MMWYEIFLYCDEAVVLKKKIINKNCAKQLKNM